MHLHHDIGVHQVARICSAAHGGQVLLSESTVDAVGGHLPAGGSLSLAQTLEFESPGTLAFLTVAAQLIDDEGNLVSHQATALVE
jgi:class 3 adenylate cyclase